MAQIQQFQPINYSAMQPLQDPTSGFMEGLQIVQQFRALKDAAEARKLQEKKMAAEAERLAQYRKDIESYNASPTVEGASALSVKYPEHREAYSGSWGMLSKAQQDQEFRSGTEAYNAIRNGRVDLAKERLTQQIQLTKDSGKPTKNLEAMLSALDSDPTKVAGQLGLVLSSVDPDRWAKMGAEQRAQEQAPYKLEQEKSNAIIKAAEAVSAPEKYKIAIEQDRATLAKTLKDTEMNEATRRKTLAEIAALDAKRKDLEAGKIPLEMRAEAEDKMRAEYLKSAAPFINVRDAFRKIQVIKANSIGDIALISEFQKLIDPGGVVRETDVKMIAGATSILESAKQYLNKLGDGETLPQGLRDKIKEQATILMKASERYEKEARTGITRIGKERGLDTSKLFYDPSGNLANAAENESAKSAAEAGLPAPISKVFDYKTGALVPASTTATTGKVVEVDY